MPYSRASEIRGSCARVARRAQPPGDRQRDPDAEGAGRCGEEGGQDRAEAIARRTTSFYVRRAG
jgi:hypothetical protein